MVIHDFRLEYKGLTAQIDHVLINRFLDIYVCESKPFGEGVAVNERGEFSAFFQGKAYGIASPIEQNKRHITLLQRMLDEGAVPLPERLGWKLRPSLKSLILVANSAQIFRPDNQTAVEGLDRFLKNEQLHDRIRRDIDNESLFGSLALVSKIISPETLHAFALSLAAMHKPLKTDWTARFGLADEAERCKDKPENVEEGAVKQADRQAAERKFFCAACKKKVNENIAAFCWKHQYRFQGRVYCFDCQKNVRKPEQTAGA